MNVWVVKVGMLRGPFIGTLAVRVGAGIGNDKDGTSFARSKRPGVVCHGVRRQSLSSHTRPTLALYSKEP